MRICHVITTLDPGGAENHLLSLATGLDRLRFDCDVVFLKGEGRLAPRFEEAAIPVARFDMEGLKKATAWPRLVSWLRERNYDIVHTHLFKADVYGGLAAERAGVARIVSTKHNEDQYLRKRLYRWVGRRAASRARRVVCISQAVRRFFVKVARLPEALLEVIPYGIDPLPPLPRSEGLALRAELGIPVATPLVATVGRLTAQKGQRDLVRAMARVDPGFLLIVGAGEEERALAEEASNVGVADRVRLAGWRPDVRRVLAACDVFCLPSRWEGFGLVLLEAMREERPIVATSVGAIPEVLDAVGYVVPPGDVAGLADALRQALYNPPQAEALGKAGRRRMEAEYGITRMIARWSALYESVAR